MTTEIFQELRTRFRGPILTAGDAGYDDARSIWNAMIDRRPAAIARCLGVADVIEGVQFARKNQLSLCIKGGGHNIAGLAVANDSLLLDMSLMRGVWTEPSARKARAQAGCLLGDVDRETQIHGLASVQGFVSNTGIAGLTLGGGFGYLTRKYGWTSDTLRSVELVSAEGKVVRASDTENTELFWGLRGGGGNFGVVTNFEYELYPLGPEIAGGGIAWPAENAPEVLNLVQSLSSNATPDTTYVTALRFAPPAPWLDKSIHGKPMILVVCVHAGSVEEGLNIFEKLKSFRKPAGDIIQKRTYLSQQCLLDATQPKGRRYYWKSEYLPGLNSELLNGLYSHAQKIVSPHSAVILFQIGGALNQLPEHHSPVGNRDAKWVLNITASWEKAEDDSKNIDWARSAWKDLKRFSTGGTYINFLTEEEGADRIAAAYSGENLTKLARIKAKWDPGNIFRNNKNILPKA
jgi:FAD/FMN-containing dehydrogenase